MYLLLFLTQPVGNTWCLFSNYRLIFQCARQFTIVGAVQLHFLLLNFLWMNNEFSIILISPKQFDSIINISIFIHIVQQHKYYFCNIWNRCCHIEVVFEYCVIFDSCTAKTPHFMYTIWCEKTQKSRKSRSFALFHFKVIYILRLEKWMIKCVQNVKPPNIEIHHWNWWWMFVDIRSAKAVSIYSSLKVLWNFIPITTTTKILRFESNFGMYIIHM